MQNASFKISNVEGMRSASLSNFSVYFLDLEQAVGIVGFKIKDISGDISYRDDLLSFQEQNLLSFQDHNPSQFIKYLGEDSRALKRLIGASVDFTISPRPTRRNLPLDIPARLSLMSARDCLVLSVKGGDPRTNSINQGVIQNYQKLIEEISEIYKGKQSLLSFKQTLGEGLYIN